MGVLSMHVSSGLKITKITLGWKGLPRTNTLIYYKKYNYIPKKEKGF